MVSIRKRVSKKRTRRQRREKKQRGGQNNQQNGIEKIVQNELQRKSQRKSQRGGGGGGVTEAKNMAGQEGVEVWGSQGVYFLKTPKGISDSLHLGPDMTREDVLDAVKTITEGDDRLMAWNQLKKDGDEGGEGEPVVKDSKADADNPVVKDSKADADNPVVKDSSGAAPGGDGGDKEGE